LGWEEFVCQHWQSPTIAGEHEQRVSNGFACFIGLVIQWNQADLYVMDKDEPIAADSRES
jgi:hypothetical protein